MGRGRDRAASWSVPRGFIVLLGAAGAVVVVAGLRAGAGIVGPVFLALVLTVAAAPLLPEYGPRFSDLAENVRGWLADLGVGGSTRWIDGLVRGGEPRPEEAP